MFTGIFGKSGLAKENPSGTFVAPTKFMRFIPPFQFSRDIELIISQAISGVADVVTKVVQGAALLKSGKINFEVEPEGGLGEHLMAAFGTDTATEIASFVVTGHTVFTVTLNTNDFLDFIEDAGAEVSAQITAGTYTVYELCAAIKTAMEAVNGASTYTVTFNLTTRKFTITKSSGVFVGKFLTGTNNAKSIRALIGFTADSASAIAATSDTAVTHASANDAIDFTEDAGSLVTAFLTAGTYLIGASSAVAGSLCKLIKDQMEISNGTISTYVVTYSYATKKFTITKDSGVFVLKWTTGTNAGIAAMGLLGFSADSASAIAAVSNSTTAAFVMSHVFTRLADAVLPTYSWWQKNGVNYPQFTGCMLNTIEFSIKAKEFILAAADWAGLKYEPAGATQSDSYSPLVPFKFSQAALTVGGVANVDYEELKVKLDNMVNPLHVVGNGIDASKIYSQGFKVSLTASLLVENSTEWDKFIAGTASSFAVLVTGAEYIKGAIPHTLAFDIPETYYQAAPIPIGKDLIKIAFTAVAQRNVAQGYAGKMTLVNGEPQY